MNPDCWSGSPSVAKWMKDHNMNATGLGRYFWQQVTAQVLPGLNRTLGVWEDDKPQPHPDDLPKKAFGNIWQAQSTLKSVVARQFDVVLSGPWYLDQQKPGGCSSYSLQGMWCAHGLITEAKTGLVQLIHVQLILFLTAECFNTVPLCCCTSVLC